MFLGFTRVFWEFGLRLVNPKFAIYWETAPESQRYVYNHPLIVFTHTYLSRVLAIRSDETIEVELFFHQHWRIAGPRRIPNLLRNFFWGKQPLGVYDKFRCNGFHPWDVLLGLFWPYFGLEKQDLCVPHSGAILCRGNSLGQDGGGVTWAMGFLEWKSLTGNEFRTFFSPQNGQENEVLFGNSKYAFKVDTAYVWFPWNKFLMREHVHTFWTTFGFVFPIRCFRCRSVGWEM